MTLPTWPAAQSSPRSVQSTERALPQRSVTSMMPAAAHRWIISHWVVVVAGGEGCRAEAAPQQLGCTAQRWATAGAAGRAAAAATHRTPCLSGLPQHTAPRPTRSCTRTSGWRRKTPWWPCKCRRSRWSPRRRWWQGPRRSWRRRLPRRRCYQLDGCTRTCCWCCRSAGQGRVRRGVRQGVVPAAGSCARPWHPFTACNHSISCCAAADAAPSAGCWHACRLRTSQDLQGEVEILEQSTSLSSRQPSSMVTMPQSASALAQISAGAGGGGKA
jgi:hypothetical protein